MLEFDIKIGAQDLYDYMMRHNYSAPSGILGGTVGALVILVAVSQKKWAFLVLGAVLLLYLPWTLFLKSRRQALLNPAFKKPLHYQMDDEGVTVSQGETSQKQKWDSMVKAVSTSRSIILYTSKVNASIFPKAQLGKKKDALVEMISTHMPASKVKIRA